jgi:hypothetical protein
MAAVLADSKLIDSIAGLDLSGLALRQDEVFAPCTGASTGVTGHNARQVLTDVTHARLRRLLCHGCPLSDRAAQVDVEVGQDGL